MKLLFELNDLVETLLLEAAPATPLSAVRTYKQKTEQMDMFTNCKMVLQWRNYDRRSEAIASGRQAAGGARGRFWSTDCLLCTTEFSRISKERKKLKNKQNDRNLAYSFRTMKVHL